MITNLEPISPLFSADKHYIPQIHYVTSRYQRRERKVEVLDCKFSRDAYFLTWTFADGSVTTCKAENGAKLF